MRSDILVPAAQYLRMSTEHQKYSMENQSAAIQEYALQRGFEVIHTYKDAGSGLQLKCRSGLRQLLRDAVQGATYKVILVYDISRWGRFLDVDEAHYEFLCKSAGIPVHYCAETFENDGSLPSTVVKSLKRMMAGEYIRELSAKVYEGSKRMSQRGFALGGAAPYGLRRMLVSPTREPKHVLGPREHKNIQEDRVILSTAPRTKLNACGESSVCSQNSNSRRRGKSQGNSTEETSRTTATNITGGISTVLIASSEIPVTLASAYMAKAPHALEGQGPQFHRSSGSGLPALGFPLSMFRYSSWPNAGY